MARKLLWIPLVAAGLCACNPNSKKDDVLATADPGKGKPTVAYATLNCTVPNADGVRCDQKTCKKDAASDCGVFKDRCTQSGHSYEGNNDQGTCIRGDQVG
jgi:hypothetical protein